MALQAREMDVMARSEVPDLLAEMLGTKAGRLRVKDARTRAYAFSVVVEDRVLLFDVLGRAERIPLVYHWHRLVKTRERQSQIPIVVVPFMPPSARAWCEELQINWLDLSGNASVRARGFHVHVKGNPNRHARPGRPSSVFERRSSRITRAVLQSPGRTWSVRECARATGISEGHASRVMARLVQDKLLVRDDRQFRVRDPALLLDAWREAADFSSHQILRGHVPARSGEELVHLVSSRLGGLRAGHAATGLGAAWLYDHFAMFRLATFYVREWPSRERLDELHFREEPNGANTWLVLPNDEGVFSGSRIVDGIPCVHPVQVYVDLKDQPERAAEATEHLSLNPLLLGGGRAL